MNRYLIGFNEDTIKARSVTKQTQSRFQITPIGDTFTFRNVVGKNLKQLDDGKFRWQQDKNESFSTFTMEDHGGKTAFKTDQDTYLAVAKGGSLETVSQLDDNAFFTIEDMCRIGN